MKCRNFLASMVVVLFPPTADTELAITHGLVDQQGNGMIPRGVIVTNRTGGTIYTSGTAWTTTTAYIKCQAVNAQYSLLFFA